MKIIFLMVTLFFILFFALSQTSIFGDEKNEKTNFEANLNQSKRVFFSYFNYAIDFATFSYFLNVDGESIVTIGTQTHNTKIKSEAKIQERVKLIDKEKRIFEKCVIILEGILWVNGVRTPLP